MGGQLLRGPLFVEWEITPLVSLTRNDFNIADKCLGVSFALGLETSAAITAMLAQEQGLYQVQSAISSDRFGCSSGIDAASATEMNGVFKRLEEGGEGHSDF